MQRIQDTLAADHDSDAGWKARAGLTEEEHLKVNTCSACNG